ncbi:hypothetical protein H4R24_000527 [Coemansia sp. RSA 988]|nr:hypothetical protein H4R24_000527 [Coemansia sp. RSA 988]
MDSFHYMYPSNQFAGNQMATSMAYSTPNGTQQLMGTPGEPQQLPIMQYGQSPFQAKASPAAHPQNFSSRIPGDHESAIYCHDARNGGVTEHPVRQMVMADGSVFVEHIPGYSLVYASNHAPIDQVLGDMCAATRPGAGSGKGGNNSRAPRERTGKPSNSFIMYRNFKIKEMREKDPEVNQIDISRMAGSLWKNESEEVKEKFRAKYREEKQLYDMKKNSKRGRSDTVGTIGTDDGIETDFSERVSTPGKRRKSEKGGLGLGLVGTGGTKPRSRTLPANSFNSSNARANIFSDLRKQVAARSGAAFLDSSPFESPQLHQAYAEMSASTNANSPIPSMMNGTSYMNGELPPLNLGPVSAFPNGMSVSDHEAALYASSQTGVDPASLAPSVQEDLTSSLVNAGFAAGIHMGFDGQNSNGNIHGEHDTAHMTHGVNDIATEASIATNNMMASGFYDQGTGDMASGMNNTNAFHTQASADPQWDQAKKLLHDTPAPEVQAPSAESSSPAPSTATHKPTDPTNSIKSATLADPTLDRTATTTTVPVVAAATAPETSTN